VTSEALRSGYFRSSELGSILHASILGTVQAILRKKPWKLRAAADANSSNPPVCGLLPVIFAEKKMGAAGHHSRVVVHQKMGRQSAVLVPGGGGGFAARNHTP
jgi:hypothetical protein